MSLPFLTLLALIAMAMSWYLTRVSLAIATDRKILDVPNQRSLHAAPTPRGGGASFVAVFLLATVILGALKLLAPLETIGLLCGFAVALIGYWDDCLDLPIGVRLFVQLAASLGAVCCLGVFHSLRTLLGGSAVAAGALLLLALALVWLINLTNFMDGIDGLAGTEAASVAIVCCAVTILAHGAGTVALLFAVLATSAIGFLLWNWYPAKIFMGDVGSGFLGYCFGVLTLLAVMRHRLSLFVPIILLGVFIVDASFTLLKRMLGGERWYAPHRSHAFQHLARHFGHERTTLLVAAVNLLWLAPWAVRAQWSPHTAPLCLAGAWAPLIVAVYLLRAGQSEGPWVRVEREASASVQAPRLLGPSSLYRTGGSTLSRLYALMERHGFVAKHLMLLGLHLGCVYLAFLMRFDGSIPAFWLACLPWIAVTWSLFQGTVLLLFRTSRSHWRFTSAEEIPSMVGVATLASMTGGVAVWLVCSLQRLAHPLPRSVYLLEAFFSVAVLAGVRLSSRNLFALASRWTRQDERKRVLIYGADARGIGLLAELRRHCHAYRAVGFLDHRAEIQGESFSGLAVLGDDAQLAQIAKRYRIHEILLPSHPLADSRRQSLQQICAEARLELRVISSISDEMELQRPKARSEVVIDDLLGRPPVQLDTSSIAGKIRGQVILVTGAAGSIGSELCRQIARFKPMAIIGYEINETALFFIEREMQQLFPGVSFVPCIGSVQNRARLNDVLHTYRPQTVYHAAAYKHVPLMEQHIFEAIENNIFGTEALLGACEEHGVGSFVMISTDKAARPTSLMGASKRVAEILVRASSSRNLTCVSTRFGNVLGSNGSVIPIFRDQIARGGPVTITHPDMVRFFMTIPEAAQLVLQASSLGSSNEIFVLDMGAPVKIVDLAEKMIRLAGLVPQRDIAIQFTGIRPGEKLYEELSTTGEELMPTAHRDISVFRGETGWSSHELRRELDLLRAALDQRSTEKALRVLGRLVPDYTASREIQGLAPRRVDLPQIDLSQVNLPQVDLPQPVLHVA